jgi:XTP/dITP diphosphohydrolase
MTIIVATKNAHKVAEMSAMLGDIELVTMKDAGLDCEIEENGATFMENALIKARFVCNALGKPALADDSGLCVDALGGEPGVLSARYASEDGQNASDEANNEKLLNKLVGVPGGERTARFVSALALVFPDGREICATGICEGLIAREARGESGFGYDPLFFSPEFSKTFGEISAEEKNSISHRNRAIMQLREKLKNI